MLSSHFELLGTDICPDTGDNVLILRPKVAGFPEDSNYYLQYNKGTGRWIATGSGALAFDSLRDALGWLKDEAEFEAQCAEE